jgi:hypothetical protein
VEKLLCLGFYPYDVVHLATIARRAQERLGLDPVFVSLAPAEVAAEVRARLSAEGFDTLDRALAARVDPTIRNPIQRFRRLREANLRLADSMLSEVQPAAVLASVNIAAGIFLDEAARRGVPTVLLQLFFWGDRSFHRAWQADERRKHEAQLSARSRLRRRVTRRVEAFYGGGPRIVWDLRHAKIAVQGPALQRRLLADRVPSQNVVVTGNPLLDDLHRLKHAPEAARARIRAQLGAPENVGIITYFRAHEDRLLTLDRRGREDGQVQAIRALREAAPHAQIVVKIHPKESEAEKAFVRSLDPHVLVVSEEVPSNELIAASELVVATASTTLLQAVALDCPAVSAFLWPGFDYWRNATNWSGVDRVDSAHALTESVRRHLGDRHYQAEWRTRREAFTKAEFLLDGQGTNRVVDLIDRLMRDRTEPAVLSRL